MEPKKAVYQSDLDRMMNHFRFLKSELARIQDEIMDLNVKYCRSLQEYRAQGGHDHPLPPRPF